MNFVFSTGGGINHIAAETTPQSRFVSLQSGNFGLYAQRSCFCIARHCPWPQPAGNSEPELAWVVISGNPVLPRAETSPGFSKPVNASQIPTLLSTRGLDFLHQLSGQYVIILVYPESSRAIFIRDRAGSRACYWAQNGRRFVVSDSAAQVSQSAGLELKSDPASIAEWLLPPSTWTINKSAFANVAALLPGARLTFARDRVEMHRGPIGLREIDYPPNPAEWVAAFKAQLEKAVIDCLPAAGNPALMLSGGLDSGPAAAVAAHWLKAEGRNLEIISWYIDAVPQASEWKWIKHLNRHIGAKLHPVRADDFLPFSDVGPEMIDADSPAYNPFRPLALACYRRAAALGSKVLINASSGDFLYPHPRFALHDALRRKQLIVSARILKARTHRYGILGLNRDPALRYLGSRLFPPRRQASLPGWLTNAARESIPVAGNWPPEAQEHPYPEYITQLFGPRAASAIARENRFSERFGLQRRDPYTDFDLLKLMVNMPHSISNGIGTTKWVMREAMRGILPEDFRTKPRTGILSEFFWHGYQANLPAIRELLSASDDWQKWVRKDYLDQVLGQNRPETQDGLLVGKCIGYTLWRQKLRAQRGVNSVV
ncbi:MAG: asparagine synthetase B family protein [Xanthomonadales bacterium]|nr:asparagine synthetase B family protein [Xanthomonadales bacterium]